VFVRVILIYPVGSLIRRANGQLGVVTDAPNGALGINKWESSEDWNVPQLISLLCTLLLPAPNTKEVEQCSDLALASSLVTQSQVVVRHW
jgi:hypothetical protein